MNVEDRVGRLDFRTKEAETALRQLQACIEIVQRRSSEGGVAKCNSTAMELERDNERLREEIEQLKRRLIDLELTNGLPQFSSSASKKPVQTRDPVCMVATPQVAVSAAPLTKTTPTLSDSAGKEIKSEVKKEKPKKEKTVGSGKQVRAGAAAAPVDVSRLDFRIGLIISAKKHPDADSLYVEEVDLAEGKIRSVCSGLAGRFPLEQMQNRLAVFLCNLKPAKMRGVMSEAMIMCASTTDSIEVIDPPPGCVPGDRVIFEGYSGTPDAQLNPKKKIFEQILPDLTVDSGRVACYKRVPFAVEEKGVCTVPSLTDCIIK